MLQSIREKTSGWIAVVILGLVILTMAFFGIESYVTGSVDNYAARIEGPAKFLGYGGQVREITSAEFRERFDRVRQQERTAKGEAFDPTAFESLQKKREVLDQLVDEALLGLVAEKEGLVLPKSAVQKEIMGIQAFHMAGRFDPKQYQLVLGAQNMTPLQFEKLITADLTQRMLPDELISSSFASYAELDAYLRSSRQTRDIRYIELPPVLPAMPPPTDAEIKAWYDGHVAGYRSPEQVAIEYVELNAAAMPVETVADEATLRERYESVKARFGTVEQRIASHILVKVDEKATAAQVAAAQAKAAGLATKARAPGADFAALARANSDDVGSKDAGGDLGPVEKGVFGEEFDKVFFAMEPGQVSDPVRLADGFHVVLYRERVAGNAKPFEEVRAELEAEVLESERERVFNDIAGQLVDRIFDDPTALAPAAKALNLPVQRTGLFSANTGEGIAALPQIRKAAFADAQKTERQVSDPIEIGSNHTVVVHVIDHRPAAALPMASIRDRIINDINADRIVQATKKAAEQLLARATKGETLEAIAASIGRTVSDLPGLQRQAPNPQLQLAVDEAFRQPRPVAGKPRPVGLVTVGPNQFLLSEVVAVKDGDLSTLDAKTRADLKKQFAQMRGAVDARAFVQALRKQYKITVAEDRL
ncbi:MAG: SurA N-terminal domain-containing protein [Gammaproteobacteria bacterium]|nr:SurA N-terminal domain-containing protein [Gammaproteobacteria bacterium]